MKKIIKIVIIVLLVVAIGGLVGTGVVAGLGPLSFLKQPTALSDTKYNYSKEEVHIKNGVNNIYGVLYKTDNGNDKNPIVILSHGYNSSYKNFEYVAKSFASSGINVYAYDFCGGSSVSKSDGNTTDMSVLTEETDLNAVIDEVKGWDFVDKNNLFLLGESQGGCVSALVAASRDDINSIVLYYPALSIVDDAHKTYSSIDEIPNEDIKFMGMIVSKKYFADTYNLDIYNEIAKYENPVLIVHGTNDKIVDYSYSIKANETFKNSKLITIEGGGHGFYKEDATKALIEAYNFIKENVK